jgi:hypothetical protein
MVAGFNVYIPVPAKIWVVFMSSLQQMLSVVPMYANTTVSSSFQRSAYLKKILVLLKLPDGHSLLLSLIPPIY